MKQSSWNKHLGTVFEAAPIGMAFVAPNLHWRMINQQFCDLVGYPHAELWKKTCDELVITEGRDKVIAFRRRLGEGEVQTAKIETRFVRKDGSCVDVELRSSLVRDQDGRPDYYVDIVEDITEIKKVRAAAHEIAENYRLLVESAVDHAILRMDCAGNVTSWNTGAQNIFKYTEEEIVGKHGSIFFTPEDRETGQDRLEMETALTRGRADDDRWHVRKDGSRFWSSGVITPTRDEDGEPNGFVKILRDLTDRKLSQERTVYLSQHDNLTGLPNRRKFHEELVRVTETLKNSDQRVGILFIDLDHFKNINDTLGHHIGDALLMAVSQRLTDITRKADVCARLGGDEFGLIYKLLSSEKELAQLAEKLLAAFAQPMKLYGHQVTVNASIGITVFPDHAQDSEQLLRYADMAMYHAKKQGRSRFAFYTPSFDVEARRRSNIEDALRHAIERNEMFLHYQPQVSLDTRTVYSVEALLRSKNPCLSPMSTEEFIALADETGLIVPIGEWVLTQACKQLKAWQESGLSGLRVAINVSPRQLKDGTFVALVDRVLKEQGLDPCTLELEITERVLMEDNQSNNAMLRSLKSRGIRISVDDFGTGFSSLSYLKHFPVDSLKIDKVFVKCLPDDQHDAAIASAIIGMARGLDLEVIAEGVETESQCAFLNELGCKGGQGFLFAEPMRPERLGDTLRDMSRDG